MEHATEAAQEVHEYNDIFLWILVMSQSLFTYPVVDSSYSDIIFTAGRLICILQEGEKLNQDLFCKL